MEKKELKIPSNLLEIGEYFDSGYAPVLDFEGWRVAMLRYSRETDPSNFYQVEKHNETNEVFILTEGEADLIVAEESLGLDKIHVFPMQKNVAYNFKIAVWHQVVMSQDAHIVLFEKTNTNRENSNYHTFSNQEIEELKGRFRRL